LRSDGKGLGRRNFKIFDLNISQTQLITFYEICFKVEKRGYFWFVWITIVAQLQGLMMLKSKQRKFGQAHIDYLIRYKFN